jgi:predicted O-methyltransferase YrrM
VGQLDHVEGFLHPLEGFALYWLAKNWPGDGPVVEIGSFKGRSTCWLAKGCQEGRRGRVVAVDHFSGSPEHQPAGTHADPDIKATGSTLQTFQRNIEHLGFKESVDVHVGDSVEVSSNWREPIRFLFIDDDHSYEATSRDYLSWSPHVVQHGLVVFHDVNVWPGVTAFYHCLSSDKQHWQEVGRFLSLGVLEKLA